LLGTTFKLIRIEQLERPDNRCGRKKPYSTARDTFAFRVVLMMSGDHTTESSSLFNEGSNCNPKPFTLNDWGIRIFQNHNPSYKQRLYRAAWEAIVATLYNKQRMDPNVVQNILKGDTVHGRRPVRGRKDAGRIGIEIDGASCLFRQGETARENNNNNSNRNNQLNASAVRRVSLILAGKLAQSPWKGYEKADKSNSTSTTSSSKGRQVAVYFNTIKQALAASHDLQLLKRIEQYNRDIDSSSSTSTTSYYDNVRVLCLGQNEGIPQDMREQRGKNSSKKWQV
jgi:hypothetical protein